ncbi:hypothetical protein R3P38DRAFT_3195015 [Favolaschia claudopus]|uniref:F-box domain-containing protein n=1 Tax=Favolaschia claudopus TaxID=2862362 RepID=A0AAW0BB81_9AGAR
MISHYPGELIEQTLDFLEVEDLQSCSVVNKFWRPVAQGRIFRVISLGIGMAGGYPEGLLEIPPLETTTNTFTAFDGLLRNSPHIGSYVRTLNLGLRELVSPIYLWNEIEDAVGRILPLLLGLQHLGLFPCTVYDGSPIHIPEKLRAALSSLELRSLHLTRWGLGDWTPLLVLGRRLPTTIRFIRCDFNSSFATFGLSIQPSFPTILASSLVDLELNLCSSLDVFTSKWLAAGRQICSLTLHLLYDDHELDSVNITSQAIRDMSRLVSRNLCIIFREALVPSFKADGLRIGLDTLDLKPGSQLRISLMGHFMARDPPDWNAIIERFSRSNSTLRLENPPIDLSLPLADSTVEHLFVSA